MTFAHSSAESFNVLIVGGGAAGLEAALALRKLSGERIGDATDFAIKFGGIAAQQADVAAQTIAALAGVADPAGPFDPVIHWILLTGGRPRYLSAHVTGGHGSSSQVTEAPTWSPPSKTAAKYLALYLEKHDRLARTTA